MLPLIRSRSSIARYFRRGAEVGGNVAGNARLDLLEHRDRGADLPRRAVAALVAVVLHEGGLHRMQVRRRAQALDGRDAIALVHHGEREAGVDPASPGDDRARAALAVIAALLGPGEMQVLAQRIEERGPRVELELAGFAVHVERHHRDNGVSRGGVLLGQQRYRGRRHRRGADDQQLAPSHVEVAWTLHVVFSSPSDRWPMAVRQGQE